jgi:hypothetical protein
MKKLMLFGLGVLTSISVLTSCKKDEVTIDSPTVSFQNNEIAYTGTTENDLSRDITITVEAAGKLSIIKIYKVTDSGKTTLKTINDFNSTTQHLFVQTFTIEKNSGVNKFEVEVTDKENNTTSKVFTFTAYSVSAGAITSYSTKIMGAQFNNGIGSFLATSNGTIYSKTDAKTNASLIDFVYSYRGGNYLAFLAAPSDALLDATVNIKAENWSVYNTTKFKASSLSSSDFDAITNDTEIATITGLTETNVLNLQVGNVVAFKTATGKLGYFKVKAINEGVAGGDAVQKYQDGSIEIDVKVQK